MNNVVALQRAADRYTDDLMRQIDERLEHDERVDNECARIAGLIVTSERRMLEMIDSADIEIDVPILRNPLTGERETLLAVMVRQFTREAAYSPSWESRALAKHLAECSAAVDAEARKSVGDEQ